VLVRRDRGAVDRDKQALEAGHGQPVDILRQEPAIRYQSAADPACRGIRDEADDLRMDERFPSLECQIPIPRQYRIGKARANAPADCGRAVDSDALRDRSRALGDKSRVTVQAQRFATRSSTRVCCSLPLLNRR
jgi:hypothetical protein